MNDYISEKMLFCTIARMQYYRGLISELGEIPFGAGRYIEENGTGFEINNFNPRVSDKVEEKYCFGYVAVGHTGARLHSISLEKIVGGEGLKGKDRADDVLVVFAAPRSSSSDYVIVGWYNHATVMREYVNICEADSERAGFYMKAKAKDCTLLPIEEREKDFGEYWSFPRGEKGLAGQNHIWYANPNRQSVEIKKRICSFRKGIRRQIKEYSGENLVEVEDIISHYKNYRWKKEICEDNNAQNLLEKMLYDNTVKGSHQYIARPEPPVKLLSDNSGSPIYPRDKQKALNALARADYKCEFDKTHSSFIRRSNGTPYAEPHHLIPISYQAMFEHSLDVEANIVSLCSTCHNQLHYGRFTEEILGKLYDNRRDELRAAGIEISFEKLGEMYC